MTFAPTTSDVGEDRQDRQFIIVIPENERIVPKQDEAESDDN
jgi:hypothetical protein